MKRIAIVWVFLAFTLLVTACGGAATPALPTTQVQPTSQEGVPYPEPQSAVQEDVYPAPQGEPLQVEWARAQSAILTGMTYKITERQNLEIVLILKDGRQFIATVPSLDEVAAAIKQCGKPCEIIQVVTE